MSVFIILRVSYRVRFECVCLFYCVHLIFSTGGSQASTLGGSIRWEINDSEIIVLCHNEIIFFFFCCKKKINFIDSNCYTSKTYIKIR